MKEISKIAKSFTCECGTVNKFEFETDFDVHDIRMAVKCQACGRERTIELMNFFRKHPTFIQPIIQSEYPNQNVDVVDPLAQQNQFIANIAQNQQDLTAQPQISNDAFSEAMPLGILQDNQSSNQSNPMNMFDSDNLPNIAANNLDASSINQADVQEKPAQSIYAGLLDLHLIQEDDGIYEPFKKEENYGNDIIDNGIITYNNRGDEIQRYREKNKEKDDEETFSALFGNL